MGSISIDQDRVIVLSSTPHGDQTRIIRVLSRELGVVPLWVRLGTGKKRQAGLWHSGALLDVSGLKRKGSDGLFRYAEAHRAVMFEQLISDVRRSSVAFFLAEVVLKTLPEESAHPEVFDLFWHTLERLETIPQTGWMHVQFLGQLIALLGLAPTPEPLELRGLDLQTGEWIDGVYEDDDHLGPQLAALFVHWTTPEASMDSPQKLSPTQRRHLVLGQVRYLQHHLSGPKTIQSYDVLESIFSV
jgi:DNA repair protein RecO (recombination protein O)